MGTSNHPGSGWLDGSIRPTSQPASQLLGGWIVPIRPTSQPASQLAGWLAGWLYGGVPTTDQLAGWLAGWLYGSCRRPASWSVVGGWSHQSVFTTDQPRAGEISETGLNFTRAGRWLVYFAGWLVCPGSSRVSSIVTSKRTPFGSFTDSKVTCFTCALQASGQKPPRVRGVTG